MESPSRQSSGLAPGDVIAGKFRLDRIIGRGGMGAVWAGRHLQLDMPVALKFIESEPGPDGTLDDARVRFEREARAAGQIRSPHVVQILDHGIDGDRPYIAMELLEGEDLGQRLRRERRLGLAAAGRIATQAAKALRRAHDAGIIHRDLKPGNVFLARFDDDEVVKILDFGVAKMRRAGAIDEKLATQVGIVFGSPSYMSPEQARGVRSIDHRSDLWSLAVILFRAITGVKPFQGASIADLVVKLCVDPLPVASRVAPELPAAVDRFFERAFARDPDLRFASAPELAAAFEAAIAPPPSLPVFTIAAPPESFPGPSSGSGPHVAFTPGTLTPPPGVAAPAPVPASSEPIHPQAPAPVASGPAHPQAPPVERPPPEPTPSSGMSSLPSGGWRQAPPPSTPLPQTAAPRSRGLLVVAAIAASAVLLLFLVARQGTTKVGAPLGAAPSAAPPAILPPPSPPAPPPAPSPEPTASAAPSAASSAEAAPPASAGPRAPLRSGKKRPPNFGY